MKKNKVLWIAITSLIVVGALVKIENDKLRKENEKPQLIGQSRKIILVETYD